MARQMIRSMSKSTPVTINVVTTLFLQGATLLFSVFFGLQRNTGFVNRCW